MNRLFTNALSVLSLVAIVSPSFAQDIVALKTQSTKIDYLNQKVVAMKQTPTQINQISPVNLVKIAYQGFLENQGVPSSAAFIHSVNRGTITAETLVQSAIDKGRLSPQTLNNEGYLNVVQRELNSLGVD